MTPYTLDHETPFIERAHGEGRRIARGRQTGRGVSQLCKGIGGHFGEIPGFDLHDALGAVLRADVEPHAKDSRNLRN